MIHFVGAGPGAVDLITVRGADLLRKCGCCVYAGSLVNPELLQLCPDRCRIFNSASMTLEQTHEAMKQAWSEGLEVVRLHTGDPSIYGAIAEQIELCRRDHIDFEIVPGVSSFQSAAAELQVELTVPDVSQTVILTRQAGRTPVPSGQELWRLGQHGGSLCLFLSAHLAQQAVDDLLQAGMKPDCPVAVVYRASWPDQKILETDLQSLPHVLQEQAVDHQAQILIGEFLRHQGRRSKLYDPNFLHGARKQ